MGNITRDIELRYTPSGTAVTDIGLACNRKVKQGDEWVDETTFVDVTIWGKSAENVSKYMKKGSGIHIDGRLHMDTWTDNTTGKQRYKLKVVAESVQFLPSSNKNTAQTPANAPQKQSQQQAPAPSNNNDDGDDIPF